MCQSVHYVLFTVARRCHLSSDSSLQNEHLASERLIAVVHEQYLANRQRRLRHNRQHARVHDGPAPDNSCLDGVDLEPRPIHTAVAIKRLPFRGSTARQTRTRFAYLSNTYSSWVSGVKYIDAMPENFCTTEIVDLISRMMYKPVECSTHTFWLKLSPTKISWRGWHRHTVAHRHPRAHHSIKIHVLVPNQCQCRSMSPTGNQIGRHLVCVVDSETGGLSNRRRGRRCAQELAPLCELGDRAVSEAALLWRCAVVIHHHEPHAYDVMPLTHDTYGV